MTDKNQLDAAREFQAPSQTLMQSTHQQPNPFGALLDPQQYDQLARASKVFSDSNLVPDHFKRKPADVFVAWQIGIRLNLDPMTALQNVYVVSGKPGLSATLVIAKANESGLFVGPIDWREEGEGDTLSVTAYAKVKATGQEVSATVDMRMAQAEGWTKNKKYQSMASHMLRYRSAVFLVRRYCPQVLLGMQTVEELRDVQAASGATVSPITQPRLEQPEPQAMPDAKALEERRLSKHRQLEARIKELALDREAVRDWFALHNGGEVIHLNEASISEYEELIDKLENWAAIEAVIAANKGDHEKIVKWVQAASKGQVQHLADLTDKMRDTLAIKVQGTKSNE